MEKNKAASELAKKRWANVSKEERSRIMSEIAKKPRRKKSVDNSIDL